MDLIALIFGKINNFLFVMKDLADLKTKHIEQNILEMANKLKKFQFHPKPKQETFLKKH